ncbi:MAG: T9SS type A sorting domain-containing protein, partial [Bacteroidetes bacterium]|nr:T9SS type A sorting domain-containing protein [Bacteroidota bacterium]
YAGGAPSGNTGSPGDGQDCTSCHSGSATTATGWITSNIPALGYTAGTTYNITVSVPGSGSKGFQVSPQNAAGTLLGTLIAGTGTKTTGTGKYMTHTGSSSSDPATWTFQWTAPASGTGNVTFYGAFCVSYSNTKLSTLVVGESAVPTPTVFYDNFNRDLGISPLTNGGTPTMTWTTASTASSPGLSITNAATVDPTNYVVQIYASSTPAAGRTYITGPLSTYSSPFASTLNSNTGPVTWTFNMKTNRSTALSGFDAGNYGSAVILAMTSSNPTNTSTNGYAVVLVKGTTNNSVKLVRFANGLVLNSNVTTIIGPSPDLGAMTRYASIEVVYTPSSNTWQLYVRDDGSTTDPLDPAMGTLTQVGTSVVNSTYTSSAMTHFGFFWCHSNGAGSSNKAMYDNFKVDVTPIVSPTLSVVPSSLTGFNYVTGSGPSASQSYLLSGVNLTGAPGNIAVGCLTNYEVSTDSINYFASVNVGYTSATLPSTKIHVRLKAGLSVGNYNSETVSNAGGGASQNVTCSGFVLGGPTAYAWTGATDNSWTVASNWSPARTAPALNDILNFNNGGTYTVTNVPAQTIAQLSVTGGSKITLQAVPSAILTIAGTTGDDLTVSGSGSELNISGTNVLTISMNAGTNGLISSSMTLSGAAHTVKATDVSSLIFASGSVFKATTGFTGNAFGTTALNSVRFQSGATYVQDAGSNPFGAGQPSSVLTFESGSLYKFTASTGGPSYSGRTYANFENDSPSIQNNQGSNPMTCDNYVVTSGTVNWDFSGGVVVKGSISVAPAATLTFGNATKITNLTLSGSAAQTISGSGTLTFGANSYITVNNPTGIVLARDIAADSLVFQSGIISTGSNTLFLTTAANITGAGTGKYVNGKLQLNIPTGATSTSFAIGDATSYTPVILDFAGVTIAGTLTASTTTGLHPNAATSGINTAKCVNRFWTLTNSSIAFTSCDATFTFVPGDILGGANTNNFIVKKWDPSAWSSTAISTLTATTTKITGISSFSDFMVGEPACIAPAVYDVNGGGAYCFGGSGMPVGLAGSEAGVEYQLYLDGTTPVGLPITGIGGAISFGDQTVAGSYSVIGTRTSGGCSSNMNGTVTITINPLMPVSVSIAADANPVNEGTLVTFTATPVNEGSLPTYQWSVNAGIVNGATNAVYAYNPVNNDQVVCVLTSNIDCGSTNPATSNVVTMTVNPVIPADLTVTGTVSSSVCYNATNTITVAGGSTLFTVEGPDGDATFIAGNNILFEPGTTVMNGGHLHGSIYNVTWCGTKSATILTVADGENMTMPVAAKSGMRVYPNPTTGVFTLEVSKENSAGLVKVEVYGMQGEKVLNASLSGENQQTFSLDRNPAGCYFIRVISNDKAETIKIIKQ